jgi:hypothetical protein
MSDAVLTQASCEATVMHIATRGVFASFAQKLEAADPGTNKAELSRAAIKVFVRVQAGKRLAALGGKAPRMKSVPRCRPL